MTHTNKQKFKIVNFYNNYLVVMSRNRKQTGDIVGTNVKEKIWASLDFSFVFVAPSHTHVHSFKEFAKIFYKKFC
jgi:hypothetical protein